MAGLDYEAQKTALTRLYTLYPFLRVQVVGRSVCGRAIFALQVGNAKNSVLYLAGLDGSTPDTGAVLFRFLESVCRSLQDETPLCGIDLSHALCDLGITVLPFANPDGTEIALHGASGAQSLRANVEMLRNQGAAWCANAAGIEVQRNFPFDFSAQREASLAAGNRAPAAAGFIGTSPASAPETQALIRFCHRHAFRKVLLLSAGAERLSVFSAKASRGIATAAKIVADCAEVPCALPTQEDVGGTFSAWFAETFRRPVFSLSAKGDHLYDRLEEALVLFALL